MNYLSLLTGSLKNLKVKILDKYETYALLTGCIFVLINALNISYVKEYYLPQTGLAYAPFGPLPSIITTTASVVCLIMIVLLLTVNKQQKTPFMACKGILFHNLTGIKPKDHCRWCHKTVREITKDQKICFSTEGFLEALKRDIKKDEIIIFDEIKGGFK